MATRLNVRRIGFTERMLGRLVSRLDYRLERYSERQWEKAPDRTWRDFGPVERTLRRVLYALTDLEELISTRSWQRHERKLSGR